MLGPHFVTTPTQSGRLGTSSGQKKDKQTLFSESKWALADASSPIFFPGAFQLVAAMFQAEPKITENFKTGKGLGLIIPNAGPTQL